MAIVPRKELLRRTIEALEASVKTHPGNKKLVHQLAQAYLKAGQFHLRALSLYEQASEIAPDDMKMQRAVAIGYMIGQGRELIRDIPSLEDINPDALFRSLEKLRELAQEYPDSPDVHIALGDIELIRGEYREALAHYRAGLALGCEDLDPMCAHFEALQAIYPLPPNVVVFFADIYQRAGRPDSAHLLYRQLLDEGELDEATLQSYYDFLLARQELVAHDRTALADVLRECCQVALLIGNTTEAIQWANKVGTRTLSSHPTLVKKLARVMMDLEDYRQAFDFLTKIGMDGETKALLNEIAVLLEQRGEIDTAVYLLRYINEHDVGGGGAAGGQSGASAKDPTEVFAATQERPGRGPDWEIEVTTELQLAGLHWRNRRWKSAFESYLKALELGLEDYRQILEPLDSLLERLPDVNEMQMAFLANYFAEHRDWRRSLTYAEKALGLDPTLDAVRARLIQACEQLLLQDPNNCDVRLRLGDMYLEKSNYERAMKEYRKAATYPEFSMKASRRMAVALHRAGDLKAALQKFQAIPVLESEDLERLYDLMISFQNAELWTLALEAATLIKEYDPAFRDVVIKMNDYNLRITSGDEGANADPKMRELIGDHSMGRYRYISKIGSGGMGVVHKVLDLKTNQTLAMKILREGLSGSDKAIDRFFREARIAATLRHPNIVQIIDYNISNTYGQSYIAMEFVDGPSMRDIVEEKFQQTYEVELGYILQVIDWSAQICDALAATHKKGIIHRDIKPDNILVAPDNIIKLTDFGIVHVEEATFTPTGALIGTPRYMSPEQVHGGRIDQRSDIYSVGVIIYEMLIGSPPFISGDISYQQVNILPQNPRSMCAIIPEELDRAVMKCLEKNPAERYQNANDLRRTLQELFVRMGGNPERLHTTAREEYAAGSYGPPILTESPRGGDTVDSSIQLPATPAPEPPPASRYLGPKTGGKWRPPTPLSDFDFELEPDVDLDDHDEDADRQDRVVPKKTTGTKGSGSSDVDMEYWEMPVEKRVKPLDKPISAEPPTPRAYELPPTSALQAPKDAHVPTRSSTSLPKLPLTPAASDTTKPSSDPVFSRPKLPPPPPARTRPRTQVSLPDPAPTPAPTDDPIHATTSGFDPDLDFDPPALSTPAARATPAPVAAVAAAAARANPAPSEGLDDLDGVDGIEEGSLDDDFDSVH